MSKKSAFDYRAAKKVLNRYHRFSFPMPRKGKDFSPQQKSAITRKFRALQPLILQVVNERASFVPGLRVTEDAEGIRTNRGTFIRAPRVTVKKPRKTKKKRPYAVTPIETRFGKRREIFLPFPSRVKKSQDQIQKFIDYYTRLYRPDYVRWAVKNMLSSHVYDPGQYQLYGADVMTNISRTRAGQSDYDHYFTGVYLGFDPHLS